MDTQRAELVKELLVHRGYYALICREPQNVLMFTGYQPMLGDSFCIVSLGGNQEVEVRLVVPEQERDLIPAGAAMEVRTFSVETMHYIGNTVDAARKPLGDVLRSVRLHGNVVVGIEGGRSPIIPAYTQVGVPGLETYRLLHMLLQGGDLRDATAAFNELASVKTDLELTSIRQAERIACDGFEAARQAVRVGATEAEIAASTTAALLRAGYAAPGARHVQPFVHVMAGKRAALAYRAFNLTSNAAITQGDTVLVQMEVGINGYWVELTRTFFAGTISEQWQRAYHACREAQDAALRLIRQGAMAHDVDEAARNVLRQAGFGEAFRHGLGHGFGFQAINHDAIPVLHPASMTRLRSGMIHNMEPAVYLDDVGGFRLNDNVLVKEDSNEVLSQAIPRELTWLVVE